MKRAIIVLIGMISSFIAIGQDLKMMNEITCTPPKFTGINGAIPILLEEKYQTIEDYLAKNVVYPEAAIMRNNQGTEVVSFIVTTRGELTDFKVINSVCPEIDQSVISALEKTNGMWKPGLNDDKTAAMEKEVSVVFRQADLSFNDFLHMTRNSFTNGNEKLFVKQNPKKALRHFNRAVVLMPNDRSLLVMRGLARYEIGDKEGAYRDWTRIKTLGGISGSDNMSSPFGMNDNDLRGLKGYAELVRTMTW